MQKAAFPGHVHELLIRVGQLNGRYFWQSCRVGVGAECSEWAWESHRLLVTQGGFLVEGTVGEKWLSM